MVSSCWRYLIKNDSPAKINQDANIFINEFTTEQLLEVTSIK